MQPEGKATGNAGDASVWHLLQVSDVLDMELAEALSELTDVVAWEPQRSWLPGRVKPGSEAERTRPETNVRVRALPLLHGYAKLAIAKFAPSAPSIVERIEHQSAVAAKTPLICTVPYFAGVAELWPGPVVYWLTDLIAEYKGADRGQVESLDRRMCAAATLVCPNSDRLADYLAVRGACPREKICVLPNATRASNLLAHPALLPGELPPSMCHLKRPIAGVIGNLAGNMDWVLLEQIVSQASWLDWVFVGPASMEIPESAQARARKAVIAHSRTHFLGKQPYGDLAAYARAFDVAVLPYRRCEPTYSGSSTRFYEHLAACRPMIATRGFAELLEKEPLLKLVDTASEAVAALDAFRAQHFNDGLEVLRWKASREGTWSARASTLREALADRVPWLRASLDYLPEAPLAAIR